MHPRAAFCSCWENRHGNDYFPKRSRDGEEKNLSLQATGMIKELYIVFSLVFFNRYKLSSPIWDVR